MHFYKNLANYLTVSRIIAIPLIVVGFYFEDHKITRQLSASVFLLACLTDIVDGYIARKFHTSSRFGRFFDPVADKILVSCVILMLVKAERAPIIPSLLILSREFLVSGLREFLAESNVNLPVSKMAKIKTFMQMCALTILIIGAKGTGIKWFDDFGTILLWLSAILTFISGFSYMYNFRSYFLS